MKKTKPILIVAGLIGLLFLVGCRSADYRAMRYVIAECQPDWVREWKHKSRASNFRRAAEQGDAEAQCELAVCYFLGLGVPCDRAEAVKWYHKAAEQGNAQAHCRLAYCYYNGEGVSEDKAEAIRRYHIAAELGNCEAQWKLGACYLNGIEVQKNEEEAAKWFRKSAEHDYYYAQYLIGRCYFEGTGVPKDDIEAAKWLQKPDWYKEAVALLREIQSGNPRTPDPEWGKTIAPPF